MEGGLHFNVFTVDFNEELVALYGGSLLRQTHFLHESIKAILRLYKVRPWISDWVTPSDGEREIITGLHLMSNLKWRETKLNSTPARRLENFTGFYLSSTWRPHLRALCSSVTPWEEWWPGHCSLCLVSTLTWSASSSPRPPLTWLQCWPWTRTCWVRVGQTCSVRLVRVA